VSVIKPAVIEAPEIEEEKTKPAAQELSSQEEGSELVKEEIPAATTTAAAKEKISEPPAQQNVFPLAANPDSVQPEEAALQEQRPMPLAAPAEPLVKIEGEEITITIGPRTYRV